VDMPKQPQGVSVYPAPTLPSRLPVFSFAPIESYIFDIIKVNMVKCCCMENEARRRAQVLSSHNIEEFRAFLKEKANESVPQPASYRMGGIVRAVFPQLSELRKRGYTLHMLVRIFAENGLRITPTALSGYMKKLNWEAGGESAIGGRKGTTQLLTSGSETRRHLAMKPDVPL